MKNPLTRSPWTLVAVQLFLLALVLMVSQPFDVTQPQKDAATSKRVKFSSEKPKKLNEFDFRSQIGALPQPYYDRVSMSLIATSSLTEGSEQKQCFVTDNLSDTSVRYFRVI